MNIDNDMRVCKGIAMAFSPKDTGNLRFNAIKNVLRTNGFTIKYSLSDAFYIYFLEEGTKKSKKHLGFISNRTVPAIANYLYTKYETNNNKQLRKIQNISRHARLDMGENFEQREQRHQLSLSLDLDKVSKIPEKEWQHNPANEVFDEDWKRGDFF